MKTSRPRINRYDHINVLHEDAPIYILDNTKRKRRIPAVVVASLRDNQRMPSYTKACNDLFPYRKISAMIIRAINKGKAFTYRNDNLSDEVALDTTPVHRTANITQEFIERQRESIKNYGKRLPKNEESQASAQLPILQVA